MNIYVGNLAYSVTENDLRSAFEPFGQIASINIIKDKFSGQSKGFGFVEMPSADEARSAINDLNGCLLYTSPSPRDRTRARMPSSA